MKRTLLVGIVAVAACGGTGELDDVDDGPDGSPTGDGTVGADGGAPGPDAMQPFPWVRCSGPGPLPRLVENRAVYDQDPLEVQRLDVELDDLAGFADVNAGVEGAEVAVVFSDGTYTANGRLRIRGGASRENVQKNYKVEIDDELERWNGQREINLNKHMWDLTRFRNKLSFDLFQTVPDMTSLRTRFVQLFVNGEDYGLYTWIEEPDKKFLLHHGLDPNGALYKAVIFSFKTIAPEVLSSPELLEEIIDPKANADNPKLDRMLRAIADPAQDIDQIVATYFQRDNLITWLAVNILLNDVDTITQNFFLYSPSSCEGWYFLPWDYDGAWGIYGQLEDGGDERLRWQSGLSNWWGSKLWKRFIQKPANRAAIRAKMDELIATTVNDDAAAELMASYAPLVRPFIQRHPDIDHLPGHYGSSTSLAVALWEGERLRISTTVTRFEAEYDHVIERPMQVFMSESMTTTPIEFIWARSVDLQGDPLTYDFQLATSPTFAPETVVIDAQDLDDDEYAIMPGAVPPGPYYWRVVIEDHQHADSWQLGTDQLHAVVIP